MPTLDVINAEKAVVGSVDLPDELYGEVGNTHVVWEVVSHHLAARRRGTHATKTRGEVSGGGRKPWRQKGTGRARVGSTRNPLWRHGGTTHGPQPRDYATNMPRKKKRVAARRVLASLIETERVTVLDTIEIGEPKTRALVTLLASLGVGEKALLLVDGPDENLERASSNLRGVSVVSPEAVNAYELLKHRRLVASKDALSRLGEVLGR